MYCLGIDTSCYTTSLAVVNEAFELCHEERIMLEVPPGSTGLRQSDAFFQHIRNLSRLLDRCMKSADPGLIRGIAVSTRPRSIEGSYMPVFTAGLHMAAAVNSVLKQPIFEVSHQNSHIQAGLWSLGQSIGPSFLAYHISGGTTELLYVRNNTQLEITEIGGTSDLNAGQFIDRAGVAMGLKFPCGKEMDRLCADHDVEGIEIPVSVNGCMMSFSGPESHVRRLIGNRAPDSREMVSVSMGVFMCIARSIEKTVINAKNLYEADELLFIGGVASNSIIRDYLKNSCKLRKIGIKPVFAEPRYSSDNAVGTAVLGMRSLVESASTGG